jgi:probable F420-dependent oxidoreductase
LDLKFGVHYRGDATKANVAAYAQRLEKFGFDGFWITEGARNRDPLTLLAAAASVTDLELGTGVLLLPFRHPVLLARAVATLDALSNGKVILGVGVGGERRADFQAYGIDPRERGPRTNEALELMKRLWQEKNVTHAGRFFKVEDATLDARPVQRPHPPLWIGGRLGGEGKSRDAALRRTARYGDAWLPYLVSPEQYATGVQRLTEYAKTAGRDPASFTGAAQVYVGIAGTREEALAGAMDTTARAYGLNESQVERFCALGTVEDVVARLKEYVSAGVRYFVVQWSCLEEKTASNIDAMASEVIPALRDAV